MRAGQIAVDAHALEGKPQGIQTTLVRLLREIGRAGRATDFAIYCSDADLCRQRLGDYPFSYVKIPAGGAFRRLLANLPVALTRNHADMALWQYISSPLFFGRNIVVIHDVLPYTHPHLFPVLFRIRCQVLFFISMLFATKILTVSEFSKRELVRIFPFFSQKVEVVHNGPSFPVDAYYEPATGPGRKRPYILAVGRIEERKNIKLLVQSFVEADVTGVDLVIVGKADLGYSAQFPHDGRIDVRSDVDDAELIELYKGAALFVFPSVAEGFGLPVLDAIAFGVPCICSNQTAMPDIAEGMARFFDPTLVGAQDVLTRLIQGHFGDQPIESPTLEQRRARLERYSWAASAAKLIAILDGLAGVK